MRSSRELKETHMTQDLIKGAMEFKHYHYGCDDKVMENLVAQGQDPKYFIISCIDSRCNPYTIFRAPPGLFFTHKAMGAIVRPYAQGTALAAALQFALEYNNIESIIVLGHTQCGGIKALAEGLDDPEISSFVSVAQNAHDKAQACCAHHDDALIQTEQNVITQSTKNLKSYPSVQKALKNKTITIKSWQFNMATGDVLEYDDTSSAFTPLTSDTTASCDSRKKT